MLNSFMGGDTKSSCGWLTFSFQEKWITRLLKNFSNFNIFTPRHNVSMDRRKRSWNGEAFCFGNIFLSKWSQSLRLEICFSLHFTSLCLLLFKITVISSSSFLTFIFEILCRKAFFFFWYSFLPEPLKGVLRL